MNVKNYKTIVLLFEAMQGGNHLTNMISLSPHVENRWGHEDFVRELEYHYYKSNAKNGHVLSWGNKPFYEMVRDSTKPMVFAGHIYHLYDEFMSSNVAELGPVGFIIFENFKQNTVLEQRMSSEPQHYLQRWVYQAEIVRKVFGVTEEDTYVVEPADFFVEDANDFYKQLSFDLNLDLAIDQVLEFHTAWFNKIK